MSIALALSPLSVVGVGALLLMLIEAFSAPSPGQVGAHGTAGLALGTTTVLFTSMAFAATLWMVGVAHVAPPDELASLSPWLIFDRFTLFFDITICLGAALSALLAGGYLLE